MIDFYEDLNREKIKSKLNNPEKFNIIVFNSIGSTNRYLKDLAKNGERENCIVISDSQTEGHGRFNRKFHSPKGTGIYMSILLKPCLRTEASVLITAAAAVAVCEAIETLSNKTPKIKWVNDILIDSKKVCGILTEGSVNMESGNLNWAVLGIGINAYTPESGFENDIKDIAAAVFENKKAGLRNLLTAEIINRFYAYFEALADKSFLAGYKRRLSVLGKEINVIKNGVSRSATAISLDDSCRLLVKYENDTKEYLNSGEISIKL